MNAPRLKEIYAESVVPALMKKFEYSNVMEIPKIEKVVISVGCGDAENTKMRTCLNDIT